MKPKWQKLASPSQEIITLYFSSFVKSLLPKDTLLRTYLYPQQTLFVVGILFSRCPCVRPCVHPSVTFCFLNNSKSHCWIFIKPCKHVYICKTNTLGLGPILLELFPFVVLNGF